MVRIEVTSYKQSLYIYIDTKMFNLYQYANGISSILYANISFVLIAYLCFIEYALLGMSNNENIKKCDDESYILLNVLKKDQNTKYIMYNNIVTESNNE